MRVIRVQHTTAPESRRLAIVAAGLLAVGVMAITLLGLSVGLLGSAGTMALVAAAALGIGVGIALTLRVVQRDPTRHVEAALMALLEPVLDESYLLVTGSRLPGVPRGVAGLLVGPAGVRVLTVRGWRGRYRVRGRQWQYDTRGPRGWINCRTNPSYEASLLRDSVARWAQDAGLMPNLPIEPAVVFPKPHSQVTLEEPDTEVVTTDNAPWWAQSIGRVQRLDATRGAHLVEAVMSASLETPAEPAAGVQTPGAA